MKNKFLILLILMVTQVLCSNIWAQSDPPLRIELPTAQDADDYHFTLMGKEGAMVFYEGLQLSEDSTEWVMMHYDTNLQKQYAYNIYLPPQAAFRQSFYEKGSLYLLYQDVVGKKEIPKTYISVVDIEAKKLNCTPFKIFPNSKSLISRRLTVMPCSLLSSIIHT